MPGTLNVWSTLNMEAAGVYKILVNFYRLHYVIPQFNDDQEMEAVISGTEQCEQFTAFMIICIMIGISFPHIMWREVWLLLSLEGADQSMLLTYTP
jgi:hypothetical protein